MIELWLNHVPSVKLLEAGKEYAHGQEPCVKHSNLPSNGCFSMLSLKWTLLKYAFAGPWVTS